MVSGRMRNSAERSAGKTQCLIPFPGWQRVWTLSVRKDGKDNLDYVSI
ncbi:hypothetical protein KCP78_23695 [Salmonella enterica subsp. enterica]|nr:hypothetical protein KCP78_23695 [Salmonella enterica subsp. enterica]